jgi:hypothetical protein
MEANPVITVPLYRQIEFIPKIYTIKGRRATTHYRLLLPVHSAGIPPSSRIYCFSHGTVYFKGEVDPSPKAAPEKALTQKN